MMSIVEAKPLDHYSVWLKFSDGLEGNVDLSGLAGKGVFSHWLNEGNFQKVKIGSGGELIWDDAVDLCADDLYMRLSGKTPEDLFPALKTPKAHA